MISNPVRHQRILGIVVGLLLVGCAPERDAGSTSSQDSPEQTDQRAVGTGDLTRIVFKEISEGESFATDEGALEVTELSTDAAALRRALAVERDFLITLFGQDIRLHPDPESAFTSDTGGEWSGDAMADSVVLGPAVFVAREDHVYGSVSRGKVGYELVSTDRGATFNVREIDIEALPNEAPPEIAPDTSEDSSAPEETPEEPEEGTIHQIDVLLLYHSDFVKVIEEFGIDMDVYAASRQKILDKVYTNGANKLPVRITIKHHEEYKDALPNKNSSPLLAQLANDPDVLNLRDQYDADLVALVVNDISNACGVGYLFNNGSKGAGFSVTDGDCEFKFTMAHEIGHNLGADHARGDGSNDPKRCNYGYRIASKARTLMAYDCPTGQYCPRQPYFSDTSVKFVDAAGASHVMGVACNTTNAASNVERVRTTLSKVAAYEP